MSEKKNERSLREKASSFPPEPGVYLMKDDSGTIIYIGKARSLRKRVLSYFQKKNLEPKTAVLVDRIREVEYIVTDSEMEALLLESSLIKRHKPRFNVRLKDDKRYPYIAVTLQEEYPGVIYTRKLRNDGTRYFGPYTDAAAAKKTVDMINRLFKLKTCRKSLPLRANERPCLNFQLKRCSGLCTGRISRQEYLELINNAISFLEGSVEPVIKDIHDRMMSHSQRMEYEKAASLREILFDIQKVTEEQKVSAPLGDDRDYLETARFGDEAIVILFEFRNGVLLGRKVSVMDDSEISEEGTVVQSFMVDYYERSDPPARIITPCGIPDRNLIEEHLTARSGHRVVISRPGGGDDAGILRLMQRNLDIIVTERRATLEAGGYGEEMADLGRMLSLPREPESVVCFDISNIQGTHSVASMVTFREGHPEPSEYRRFRIRGYRDANDPGMIHEAVSRRLQHLLNEDLPLPDLMVIDGGPTQLARAREAARTLEADLPIISLAKREEEVYADPEETPFRFSRERPGLKLLMRIRDEAHRFAVTYHRTLRDRAMLRSEIDAIPGIGDSVRRSLLASFGHLDAIKSASIQDLERVEGVGRKRAEKIVDFFSKKNA